MTEVVCCNCTAVNRLPADKPADAAKCGKCGARLFTGKPCEVSIDSLNVQIARSSIPVVLDVWAPWCGPCRMIAPAYEAAARELEPNFRLVKLNSDQESKASARLDIGSIPTVIIFQGGKELVRVSGAMTANQIVAWARGRTGIGAHGNV